MYFFNYFFSRVIQIDICSVTYLKYNKEKRCKGAVKQKEGQQNQYTYVDN